MGIFTGYHRLQRSAGKLALVAGIKGDVSELC